jgi:hypothetical protein
MNQSLPVNEQILPILSDYNPHLDFRKVPDPSRQSRQARESPGTLGKVPARSGKSRQAPESPGKFENVPARSGKSRLLRESPGTLGNVPARSGKSRQVRESPGSFGKVPPVRFFKPTWSHCAKWIRFSGRSSFYAVLLLRSPSHAVFLQILVPGLHGFLIK